MGLGGAIDGAMEARRSAGVAVRLATPADVPAMQALIARSACGLNAHLYDDRQLAAAVGHVFGVDSALIEDGSYYVAERDGVMAGCGGWSGRRTLFGGDRFAVRDDEPLDPETDAARIRAFFVDPAHARRGVATALLAASEAAAAAAGFARLELMATLPGVAFYAAAGFAAGEQVQYRAGDVAVPFVPMTKRLSDQAGAIRPPTTPLAKARAEKRVGRAMS